MKILLCIILCFVAGLTFLPRAGSSEIRNLPLLIFLLALGVAYVAFKLIKRLRFAAEVKKRLTSLGFEGIESRFLSGTGSFAITAKLDGVKHNIVLCSVKNRKFRYHFDGTGQIQIYKYVVNSWANVRGGRGSVNYHAQMREAGTHLLPWHEEYQWNVGEENILIMDKMPSSVTDPTTREGILGNGDRICGRVLLYDLNGFLEYKGKTDGI